MADTIGELPVIRAFPSAGTLAKIASLNNRFCVQFDTNNQELLFQGILTDKYLGGNIGFKLFWVASPYVAGTTTFELAFKRLSIGIDYTSAVYNIIRSGAFTAGGLNLINVSSISFTNAEMGYAVGALDELFQLRIKVTSLVGGSKINLLNVVMENV